MNPPLTPHEIACLEALRERGPSTDQEFARDLYVQGRAGAPDLAGWRSMREQLAAKGYVVEAKGRWSATGWPAYVIHPAMPVNEETGAIACGHYGPHAVEDCGLLNAPRAAR